MNSRSADTRNPHLDLSDLIASAAGHPTADPVREHLADCQQCRLEATRWNLVADGVRALAAAAPEPADPARQRHTRQRAHTLWKRAMLGTGSVAAAFAVLTGIGVAAGLVHVHLNGSGTGTALTAVTGCSQLQQANGTLERVDGTSLVIQTSGGPTVTVTTTGSTFMSMSGALLNDITDGASVVVRGYNSAGTIQAAIITVGQPFSAVNPSGFVPVQGTVSDATAAGFTLVTSTGTRIPVTTSGGTLVVVPHATPAQFQPGAHVYALGTPGPAGTLSARALTAVSQLPSGGHISVHTVSVKDCSPTSIAAALSTITASRP